MKKIPLILVLSLFVQSLVAQNDSLAVRIYNRSGKEVFMAFAYYAKDSITQGYTIGWYEIPHREVLDLKLQMIKDKGLFYHAHNILDRNDNWGGERFFMVHPFDTFWLGNADNALFAYAYDEGLSKKEEQAIKAYPFREIEFSEEENKFMLLLK
ncbi:MAG: hypothetical protein ACFB0B_20350 [Thermonemataceae bacterium]